MGESPGSGTSSMPEMVMVSKADHNCVSPIWRPIEISLASLSMTWSVFKTLNQLKSYTINGTIKVHSHKVRQSKFLWYYWRTSVHWYDEISIIFTFSTNDITFDWSAVLWLVKRSVDRQNFIVSSYPGTLVLRKEYKWSRLNHLLVWEYWRWFCLDPM